MMTQKKLKKEIREELLARRSSLSDADYDKKSHEIIRRLTQTDFYMQARVVHCYISMNSRNEVNTFPLIENILESEKKLVVPVMNSENGTLRHLQINSIETLRETEWGVMEPESGVEISPEELDLIIVPMVGADEEKNRIGYGKGFYDRFLEAVNCTTTGLVFESCVVPKLPVEPHDRKLSVVITEKRIIY